MSVLDNLKRRCHPVGDTGVFVRSLTIGELARLRAITDEKLKSGFMLGCVVTDKDGKPEFSIGLVDVKDDFGDVKETRAETDEEFAKRVGQVELADVDTETIAEISAAVGKIGKTIVGQLDPKNSDPTAS